MEQNPDVLIIGGGLAGLACGIHLARTGTLVTIIEKSSYPKHKVCGEYISNEILPYLQWLGVDVVKLKPVSISRFEFSSGSAIRKANLPLGGFGVSRYALDNLLYNYALQAGCKVIEANATDVKFKDDEFTVTASDIDYKACVVIGAYGKRSNLDQALGRKFFQKKSPWLAVKAHYRGVFPDDVVALHNFSGGYCGVSKVEDDIINICYLADYQTFKRYRNIEEYQQKVLGRNMHVKTILENSTMVFEKPLTISQISFEKRLPVENHILMTGDTAGLIHPLCGNGMAMAIHSAKIAAEKVLEYLEGKISRAEMEQRYRQEWGRNFSKRLRMGRMLGRILQSRLLTKPVMGLISTFPVLLPKIIKQTHGKPIKIAS